MVLVTLWVFYEGQFALASCIALRGGITPHRHKPLHDPTIAQFYGEDSARHEGLNTKRACIQSSDTFYLHWRHMGFTWIPLRQGLRCGRRVHAMISSWTQKTCLLTFVTCTGNSIHFYSRMDVPEKRSKFLRQKMSHPWDLNPKFRIHTIQNNSFSQTPDYIWQ